MSRFSLFGAPRAGAVDDTLDLALGSLGTTASPLRESGVQGTYSTPSSLGGGGETIVESVSGLTDPVSVGFERPSSAIVEAVPTRCLFVTNQATYSSFCFGIVGSKGEKFCMKRISDGEERTCGIGAHSKKITTLDPNYIYYKDDKKDYGYTSPKFSRSHPMALTLYEMNDESLTRLHYKELIDLIERREIVDLDGLSAARDRVIDTDSGVSFTPRKKPRFSPAEGLGSWMTPGLDSMPTIPEIDTATQPIEAHITENWPSVMSSVAILKGQFSKSEKYENEINRLGDEFDALSAAIARLQSLLGTPADGSKFDLFNALDDVEATILELDTKVDSIKAGWSSGPVGMDLENKLGDRVEKLESDLKRMITSDVAELGSRVRKLEGEKKPEAKGLGFGSGFGKELRNDGVDVDRLEKVVAQQVVPAIRDLWKLYATLTGGPSAVLTPGADVQPGKELFVALHEMELFVQKLEQQSKGHANHMEARIKSLESDVVQVKKVQASARGTQQSGSSIAPDNRKPSGFGGFGNLFGSSMNEDTSYGTQAQGRTQTNAMSWGGGFGGFGSGSDEGANSGTAVGTTDTGEGVSEARILTLEVQVSDLEAQLHNTTVTIAGHVFRSMDDCEVFVQQNVPGSSYGQFFDMISLLQRAWGQNHKGLTQSWEEKYHQMRAGFHSKNEAVISASFETMIPTPLGENTGKTTEAIKPLTGIPTREHWENNGGLSGKRHDIQVCLLKIRPTLDVQQRALFLKHPAGGSVARELLSKSESHWTQFESMIDRFFDEFVQYSSRQDAWDLCGLIGKTVLEVIYQERCIAADISDFMTEAQRGGRVLWATLQAHRVLDEFAQLTYRNHPRISPVIVLHLLKNRIARTEFDELKKTAAATQKQVDKLVTAIDMLKKKGG